MTHVHKQTRPSATLALPTMLAWRAVGMSAFLSIHLSCGLPGLSPYASEQTTSKDVETSPILPPAETDDAELPRRQRMASDANGLIPELMAALDRERVQAIRTALARQVGYRDRIVLSSEDINLAPTCTFAEPVSSNETSGGEARSIMARLLQLVEDADGLPLCNAEFSIGGHTYGQCDLFRIDSLADFYLRSIAGAAYLTLHLADDDSLGRHVGNFSDTVASSLGSPMELLTGLDGFTAIDAVDESCEAAGENCLTYSVSAEAANRMVFGTFDTRQDNWLWPSGAERSRKVVARPQVHGQYFDALHDGTLSAWECDDFLKLIKPLIAAFVRHERVDLLLSSMRLLNQLWLADLHHVQDMEAALVQLLAIEVGADR